jgi:plasmid maintenance system antidote protein VapI
MPLQFVPSAEKHASAAAAFNHRMRELKAPTVFLLPEDLDLGSALDPDSDVRRTQFLAIDDDQVRGGVIELNQPGWLNGQAVRALNFQSPLSEGIVDSKYASVGLQIVRFMQKQSPAVYIVGMGSTSNPLPRLLKAAGWTLKDIPFLFRVHRPGTFLRQLKPLHKTPLRSTAVQLAAVTGVGALGIAWKQRSKVTPEASIRLETSWGTWADDLWGRVRNQYSFAVERTRSTLQALYPSHDPRTRIFLIEQGADAVGWAVCLDTQMNNNQYFGNMRVASVLDCVALPHVMSETAALVDREMGSSGADLVLINHSYTKWVEAFQSAGFLPGPSNYLLGMSKSLAQAVQAQPEGENRMHITRGDGDGRVNL